MFRVDGRPPFPNPVMEESSVIRPELSAAVLADSPYAYWRSKSPGLPTQASLCLDCVRAA